MDRKMGRENVKYQSQKLNKTFNSANYPIRAMNIFKIKLNF